MISSDRKGENPLKETELLKLMSCLRRPHGEMLAISLIAEKSGEARGLGLGQTSV